jgi:hypothetical protein
LFKKWEKVDEQGFKNFEEYWNNKEDTLSKEKNNPKYTEINKGYNIAPKIAAFKDLVSKKRPGKIFIPFDIFNNIKTIRDRKSHRNISKYTDGYCKEKYYSNDKYTNKERLDNEDYEIKKTAEALIFADQKEFGEVEKTLSRIAEVVKLFIENKRKNTA